MLKILQYNLNNRPKQKVIKPKALYLHDVDLEQLRYRLAKRHKIEPKHIYITASHMSNKQIKALK